MVCQGCGVTPLSVGTVSNGGVCNSSRVLRNPKVVFFATTFYLTPRIDEMDRIAYKVVKHDGGWAYEANGTFSEPFPTREAARKAAKLAASEQAAPGETTQISYEDEKGRWHNEVDSGTDRPKTTVEG
jgi:hypothetical protein